MKLLDVLAMIFLIIGGLIWGMVGVADFNPIMWIFVGMRMTQHAIYILIGLSAIWKLCRWKSGSRQGKPQ
jgi:uncharacterized membrane protein YuzA (DUF378 family)